MSTFETMTFEALSVSAAPVRRRSLAAAAPYLIIAAVAGVMSLIGLSQTGALWPDGPRYLNGAVMIHDWLCSGQLTSAFDFAVNHYAQYPGFSIPYHPPAYPGMLGLWFMITGISYESARVFMAICLVGCGYGLFGIARQLGAGRWISMATALLLIVSPAIVHWSRSTMSDVPALAFILLGTWCFLKWCDDRRAAYCWAAFALAEVAFLCRVTSAGVLPGWVAYLVIRHGLPALRSIPLIGASTLYLGANMAWVVFVSTFAVYELTSDGEVHKDVALWSWENFTYYILVLPAMVGGLTAAAAAVALAMGWGSKESRRLFIFGIVSFVAYYLFQIPISTIEDRYFIFALPAVCLIATAPLAALAGRVRPLTLTCAVGAVLLVSVVQSMGVAHGITGYEKVAARLSQLTEPGNVLMCTWVDQDLIFRYRAAAGKTSRSMLRGDRTLTIRVADYARREPTILAQSDEDVLNVIRLGRVRYLLTCAPAHGSPDKRQHEKVVAHNTAMSRLDKFELIERFPLEVEISAQSSWHSHVYLWRYKDPLPDGPSELQVVIPTAAMTITPAQLSR